MLPLAALLGGSAYAALGRAPLIRQVLTWWISEITWVLLLVPALMYLRRRQFDPARTINRLQFLERLLFFALVLLLGISASVSLSPWGAILVAVSLVLATVSGNGASSQLLADTFARPACSPHHRSASFRRSRQISAIAHVAPLWRERLPDPTEAVVMRPSRARLTATWLSAMPRSCPRSPAA